MRRRRPPAFSEAEQWRFLFRARFRVPSEGFRKAPSGLFSEVDAMEHGLMVFYNLVRETRAGVLDWLASLPPEVFVQRDDRFAFGSLQAIQLHVARTYLKWVGTIGLNQEPIAVEVRDVPELRRAFDQVDLLVGKALRTFDDLDEQFYWTYPDGQRVAVSRRWLILHPITHEFHHKGQSLALARALGHPHPGKPDSDLVYSPLDRDSPGVAKGN